MTPGAKIAAGVVGALWLAGSADAGFDVGATVLLAFAAVLLLVLVLVADHLVRGFRPSRLEDERISRPARILCLAVAAAAGLLSLAAVLGGALGLIALFTIIPGALLLIGLVAAFDRGLDAAREILGKPPRPGT